ncbi:MAG: TM2 domain-containing protein [Candidatus Zixiibacteriota bacterium]|nr:MAG: TM2 domain-containing protein [candidate division Zixibacteria bacterium]
MSNVLHMFPNMGPDEMYLVQNLTKDMTESQAAQFANFYGSRRKDPQLILILTLLGFFGVAGLQRFVLDQIGMGLLYLLTAGLCFIGTIVDLVNYQRLAFEYNQRVAQQVAMMVKASV